MLNTGCILILNNNTASTIDLVNIFNNLSSDNYFYSISSFSSVEKLYLKKLAAQIYMSFMIFSLNVNVR